MIFLSAACSLRRFLPLSALALAAAFVPAPAAATAQDLKQGVVRSTALPQEITGKDGAPMRLVPAGEFTMRSHDGRDREKPPHQVYLDAFYMDTFEVTTSRYAKFMTATRREQPKFWDKVRLVNDADRPVIGVTWHDADAYCSRYGKRLPTEAEWEKAARGTEGRTYPWGNEVPTAELANYDRS